MAGANTNPMNPIMTSKVIHCHNDSDRGPVIALKVDSHEEQTTGVDGVKLLVNKKTTVLTLEYVINHAMPSTGRISVEKTCRPGYIEPTKRLPYTVYVGRQLPGSVTEEVLRDIFSKFGTVRGVSRKATFAFVECRLKREAEAAIRGAQMKLLHGSRLYVGHHPIPTL